jgi:hypothetical protein
MTMDKSGKHHEYSTFVNFDLDKDKEVLSAVDSVRSNVKQLSKDKQIATLTNLILELMDQERGEHFK